MRLYWLLTALVSLFIVHRLPWQNPEIAGPFLAALAGLAMLFGALMLFGGRRAWSGLLLRTLVD